jgi:hypothetical protein
MNQHQNQKKLHVPGAIDKMSTILHADSSTLAPSA